MHRALSTALSILGASLLAAGLLGAKAASAASVRVDYDLWLGSLPLGQADLSATMDGARYRMELQVRLTGLVGMLTGGKGAGTAAGSVAGRQPMPSSFAVSARSSESERTVRMGLSGGSVAALQIMPPLEEREDRVPVREAHKRGIVDPISALLIPAVARGEATDPANCNRAIPIFDGGSRFDIVLRYAETRNIEKPGYKGPVIVCSVRYVPVAGHRPQRPAIKFMEDNRDMAVWLAPVDGARMLLPLRIEVRTTAGRGIIEASRLTQDRDTKVVPAAASAGTLPTIE